MLYNFFYSSIAMSGGRTTAAVPTKIDTTGAHTGFMIWGAFGNPAGCTKTNAVWVKGEHPQYNKLYSTALAAFMAGKKIRIYVHSCETVGWYVTTDHTFNVLGPSGDLQISN
ncbi:hypothetical protein VNTUMSATTG_20890 [Vibrio nigripulchritudo]|nr:hypothetical protein VNTUMSATTG_20890 [Vibrio nigripulchritudo]